MTKAEIVPSKGNIVPIEVVVDTDKKIDAPESFEDYWRNAQMLFTALLGEFDGDVDRVVNYMDEVKAQDLKDYQSKLSETLANNTSKRSLLLLGIVNNVLASAGKSEVINNILPFADSHESRTNRDIFPLKFLKCLYVGDATVMSLGIDTEKGSPFKALKEQLNIKQRAFNREFNSTPSLSEYL